jgi:hypothetical protein
LNWEIIFECWKNRLTGADLVMPIYDDFIVMFADPDLRICISDDVISIINQNKHEFYTNTFVQIFCESGIIDYIFLMINRRLPESIIDCFLHSKMVVANAGRCDAIAFLIKYQVLTPTQIDYIIKLCTSHTNVNYNYYMIFETLIRYQAPTIGNVHEIISKIDYPQKNHFMVMLCQNRKFAKQYEIYKTVNQKKNVWKIVEIKQTSCRSNE